ncbi:MAG: DUF1003 domain-containing protein [Dehalococcoidia bacterium]|nr:DUF1003 domain-containing protein [Dehalococcoidia bacterium]
MLHLRFHQTHAHLGTPFGADAFGQLAARFARSFGTPRFLIVQTSLVLLWIAGNAVALTHFDPYPFILLNLAFSTQAAYAAPLILLAQTRQADRDRTWSDADARHREVLASNQMKLLELNTDLTRQVAELSTQIKGLTEQIHRNVVRPGDPPPGA